MHVLGGRGGFGIRHQNKVKKDLGELGQSVFPLKQLLKASYSKNTIISATLRPIVVILS